ncbi:hypothetical protein NMY22_g222 [Coprinellus aureogranulatus]|nr:hypothetical protein NMY22_g222 [Coprinellus aureogranulatus]
MHGLSLHNNVVEGPSVISSLIAVVIIRHPKRLLSPTLWRRARLSLTSETSTFPYLSRGERGTSETSTFPYSLEESRAFLDIRNVYLPLLSGGEQGFPWNSRASLPPRERRLRAGMGEHSHLRDHVEGTRLLPRSPEHDLHGQLRLRLRLNKWQIAFFQSIALLALHTFAFFLPVSQTMAVASAGALRLSIVASAVPINQHQNMAESTANEGHAYHSKRRGRLQQLALTFALPQALILWGLFLMSAQVTTFLQPQHVIIISSTTILFAIASVCRSLVKRSHSMVEAGMFMSARAPSSVELHSKYLDGYLTQLSGLYLPQQWSAYTHPEGQVYFARSSGSSLRGVTDSYMHKSEVAKKLVSWVAIIERRQRLRASASPKQTVELYVQLEDEDCDYCFADHVARTLFWLDDYETASLGLLPVVPHRTSSCSWPSNTGHMSSNTPCTPFACTTTSPEEAISHLISGCGGTSLFDLRVFVGGGWREREAVTGSTSSPTGPV